MSTESIMSDSDKFKQLITVEMPYLLPLFDFENSVYKSAVVEHFLGTASRGEAIMARFALGVWSHNNDFNFNFVDATRCLDQKHIEIVTKWMNEPFWP